MKKFFAAVLISSMALVGCVTGSSKVDPNAVASFKPGTTTIAQVEAVLGKPTLANRMPDGTELLQYVTIQMQDDDAGNMPVTGSSIPKRDERKISTMLAFDTQGLFVRSWSTTSVHADKTPSMLGPSLQQGGTTSGGMH